MLKFVLFLALFTIASAQYTKLQWSLCGSSILQIFNFDFTPMPIRHPGVANLILSGRNTRAIKGNIKSDVKILRTVSGVTLPISCYLVNGNQVGSCIYNDMCSLFQNVLGFNESNCPQNLIDNSINCKCPFDIPVRSLDINTDVELPDASTTPITWIGSGDFDVTIKGSDNLGQVTCLNLKFTVRPK